MLLLLQKLHINLTITKKTGKPCRVWCDVNGSASKATGKLWETPLVPQLRLFFHFEAATPGRGLHRHPEHPQFRGSVASFTVPKHSKCSRSSSSQTAGNGRERVERNGRSSVISEEGKPNGCGWVLGIAVVTVHWNEILKCLET